MALRALDTVKYHTKYYRNLPTLDRHSLGTKFKTLSPLANPTRARARARRGPLARSRWPARPRSPRVPTPGRARARRRDWHDSHSEQRVSFMKRHGTHARGWGVGRGAWGRLYIRLISRWDRGYTVEVLRRCAFPSAVRVPATTPLVSSTTHKFRDIHRGSKETCVYSLVKSLYASETRSPGKLLLGASA
jgi:hypothetical protein